MNKGYKNNSGYNRRPVSDKDYISLKDEYDRPPKRNIDKAADNKEKLPSTVKEQIEKLCERGCKIGDEKFAFDTLTEINYFRLAHYFSLYLCEDGRYRENTEFSQIIRVYDFDRRFRSLLMGTLEEIEISLRAHCSNFHAIKYGATGYLNEDTFSHVHNHKAFLSRIDRLIETNSESDLVQHYLKKHSGRFPLWVIMELFSFGTVNSFYSDMKPKDKMDISKKYYGMSSGELEIKLGKMSELRNHCAHYHRLYDWEIGDIHPAEGTVFDYILIMKRIYRRPEKWKNEFLRQFNRLYYDYKDIVDLSMLGFTEDWAAKLDTA